MAEVQVSDGQQTIQQTDGMTHCQLHNDPVSVLDNIDKVRLGDEFTPLLQAGKQLTDNINIQQITRWGSIYTSSMQVNQAVDRVTFPKVQYFFEDAAQAPLN